MTQKISIIFFDENVLYQNVIHKNLELYSDKYNFETANDFGDFINKISESDFDIILTVINSNNKKTKNYINKIKRSCGNIPIVLIIDEENDENKIPEEYYFADDIIFKNDLRRLDFLLTKVTQNRNINQNYVKETNKYQIYFEHLFISSPVAIVMLNEFDKILTANQKFLDMFQYTLPEVMEQNIHTLIIPEDLKNEAGKFSSHVRTGNYLHTETKRRKKDGSSIFVDIIAQPVVIENKTVGILGMYVDISGRKKVELELKNAKEKAEEADRLKSDFLAQMSHEIRTPINTMLNFITLLKDEYYQNGNDEISIYFESIENSGRRIIRTIDLLLNMSEIQSGTYEFVLKEINLYKDILSDIILEAKRNAAKKGIEFNINLLNEDLFIQADEYSVYQILNNLIDNAIKFTHKGKVEVDIIKEKGNLIIKISDTGIGISKEYLPDLFMPFSQEESGYTRKFEGNGLGLAIVKKYCEMNNAVIEVESEKGSGTKFYLKFLNTIDQLQVEKIK